MIQDLCIYSFNQSVIASPLKIFFDPCSPLTKIQHMKSPLKSIFFSELQKLIDILLMILKKDRKQDLHHPPPWRTIPPTVYYHSSYKMPSIGCLSPLLYR